MQLKHFSANLGPDKPYSFRAMLSQWEVADPFYRWVKDKHPQIKRVALISPNDTSGKDTNNAATDWSFTTIRVVGVAMSPEYVFAVGAGSFINDPARFGVLWMVSVPATE